MGDVPLDRIMRFGECFIRYVRYVLHPIEWTSHLPGDDQWKSLIIELHCVRESVALGEFA
jgi:hypothetical protein